MELAAAHTSKRWALAGPIGCLCAAGAAAVYLGAHNPRDGGLLTCPLFVSTGLYCPGCGLTRAAYALLHGDVGAAFGYNLLFPLFIAGAVVGWWAWVLKALGKPPLRWLLRLPTWLPVAAGALLIVFAVVRNLAPFSALAP